MKLSVSEILKNTANIKGFDDKVNYLRQNKSKVLIDLLQMCYDPRITWLLPEGDAPEYNISKLEDQEGMLYFHARKLYLFAAFNGEPLHKTLSKNKREMMFIEMLETLTVGDAELLISFKDKKMPYDIKQEVLEAAFPGEIYFGEVPIKLELPKRNHKKKESLTEVAKVDII